MFVDPSGHYQIADAGGGSGGGGVLVTPGMLKALVEAIKQTAAAIDAAVASAALGDTY